MGTRIPVIWGGYDGLPVRQGERLSIVHPCVEINMRMNMGVVARLFYDRFVAPGSKRMFCC